MNRCAEHRARALDFVLGDLAGLERTRMEAHLDRCEPCREVADRLSAAFAAAKKWPPESSAQDLEQLIGRLEPYFGGDEEPREYGFAWGGAFKGILAAAAVTAGIVFWASYSKDQAAPAIVATPAVVEQPAEAAPEIVRLNPRPHVKLVAGGGWDGKIGGETEQQTSIVMSRGFAMIDFEGGAGRKLWIGAPNAAIEVVGTRFFVDTAANGLTTIGVISGKVVVSAPSGRATIAAGQRRVFGETKAARAPASTSAAEVFAADPFLERAPASPPIAVKTQRADRSGAPQKPVRDPRPALDARTPLDPLAELDPRTPLDPLAELAAAQRLARGEAPRDALAKYDALLEALDPQAALAPLIRYERARLLAFVLHEKSRGAVELRAVAGSGRGEAALQAKLSLCELQLAEDRAAAARCLDELRVREHGALSTEIDRLFTRWNLSRDHKY